MWQIFEIKIQWIPGNQKLFHGLPGLCICFFVLTLSRFLSFGTTIYPGNEYTRINNNHSTDKRHVKQWNKLHPIVAIETYILGLSLQSDSKRWCGEFAYTKAPAKKTFMQIELLIAIKNIYGFEPSGLQNVFKDNTYFEINLGHEQMRNRLHKCPWSWGKWTSGHKQMEQL